MATLSRDQILAAQDVRFETIAVPAWGGDVRIRSMTGAARDEYDLWMYKQGQDGGEVLRNLRAKLLAISIVDEAGEPIFTEADVDELGKKSAAAVELVYERINELNALDRKSIEALAKN